MNLEKKLSIAKSAIAMDRSPFLSSVLFSMEIIIDDNFMEKNALCNTAATDGKHIYWHTEFLRSLSHEHLIGTMAHEVLHAALHHPIRLRNRDLVAWNIACDMVVNEILFDNNYNLPGDSVRSGFLGVEYDESSDTVEDIYNRIMSKAKIIKLPKGATKIVCPKESDEADIKAICKKAKDVASQMKDQGDLAGSLARHMGGDDMIKLPQLYEYLPMVLSKSRDDYSWAAPNRRFIQQRIYLPSLSKGQKVGDIVFAIDVSGSISDEEANAYARALRGLLDEYDKFTLHILMCDTGIGYEETVTEVDPMPKLKVYAGGGTDFMPVFNWVKNNNVEPDVLIYSTDLWCNSYPKSAPPYPVIWLTYREGQWGSYSEAPPWGQRVVF